MALEFKTADLEAARAMVSALSCRGNYHARPVSVIAIQSEFRKRARSLDVSSTLYPLMRVRDLQSLGRGFWLPVPTHLVVAKGFHIVVSGLATQELNRRHGLSPVIGGVSRLLLEESVSAIQLPVIALSRWLEAPSSTREWTQLQIASSNFAPPLSVDDMQIFRSWPAKSAHRWLGLRATDLPNSAIVMARHRGSTGQTNHYLLVVARRRVVAMAELPHDSDLALRLQFGLRQESGDGATFRTRFLDTDNKLLIEMPPIPSAETRFFESVGVVTSDPTTGRMISIVLKDIAPQAWSVLGSLGCHQE
jgi:hypothetical protein